MNGKNLVNEHMNFLEEQLTDAQQQLFFSRTVREVKFLQNKIEYLKRQMKEIKKKR